MLCFIKAACVAGDITVGGIAKLVGMDYFSNDSFTGSFDTNLIGRLIWPLNFSMKVNTIGL